jgi:NADPH-dependent 2,4-dienoyl-CoA reductase/sulfur reductase-like enzyme
MVKALGPELSTVMSQLHESNGVELVTGSSVEQWRLNPDDVQLLMSDGSVLTACSVVVATGTVPVTNWLRGSGIEVDDGVVCEATTHVHDTEDVVAAGDVARWPNLLFGRTARRTEHWTNALEMGRAAAENLLAGRERSRPFMPLPRFWSEQHGVRIQAAGVPALATSRRVLAGRGTRSLTGYYNGERMVAVVGLNHSSGVLQHEAEILAGAPSVGRLPSVDAHAEGAPAVAHARVLTRSHGS